MLLAELLQLLCSARRQEIQTSSESATPCSCQFIQLFTLSQTALAPTTCSRQLLKPLLPALQASLLVALKASLVLTRKASLIGTLKVALVVRLSPPKVSTVSSSSYSCTVPGQHHVVVLLRISDCLQTRQDCLSVILSCGQKAGRFSLR